METDSPQVVEVVKKRRAPRKAKEVVVDTTQPEPEPEPEPKRKRAAPRPKASPPEPAVEVDANFMASLTGTLRTMQKNERSSKIASLKIA